MDDHMYDRVWTYGNYELVPRFQKEYSECGSVQKCSSYQEIKEFCKVLNIIRKWIYANQDYKPITPSDLLDV